MTGAHDMTDAEFLNSMQLWARLCRVEGERPISEGALDRLISLARAHAAPRTVQAGVTDEQARKAGEVISMGLTRRLVENGREEDFSELARKAIEAAASVPTAAPEPDLRVENERLRAACIAVRKSILRFPGSVHDRAMVKIDKALGLPSIYADTDEAAPASSAGCSCGGVAEGLKKAAEIASSIAHQGQCGYPDCGDDCIGCGVKNDGRGIAAVLRTLAATLTPSTPCACYRAGIERAAEIAEAKAGSFAGDPLREGEFCVAWDIASDIIASDIRRAGEEGKP